MVTLLDGRQINGADLCGATEVGRKIAYCTDTVYCDGAVQLAQDADVLIHEATLPTRMQNLLSSAFTRPQQWQRK
jgi:ribonuclease Z